MIKNDYDSSLYRIKYKPYTFFSFLFGGMIEVSCEDYQAIIPNAELLEILPELTYRGTGFADNQLFDRSRREWYECPVQNNKEAEDLLIELKMLGYEIN